MTRALKVAAAGLAVASSASGCFLLPNTLLVLDPLTPEQSKAQVVDAGRELVALLNLRGVEARVRLSGCNDNGNAPFRGSLTITLPLAPTPEAAATEVDAMVRRLSEAGWKTRHGLAEGNGLLVLFDRQHSASIRRIITVLGECRGPELSRPALAIRSPSRHPNPGTARTPRWDTRTHHAATNRP